MADQQPTQQIPPPDNSDNKSVKSDSSNCNCGVNCDGKCKDCLEYPPCPPQPPKEKCEPVFVPINVEVCPIVRVKVNKPKICLQNRADCDPCYFLE